MKTPNTLYTYIRSELDYHTDEQPLRNNKINHFKFAKCDVSAELKSHTTKHAHQKKVKPKTHHYKHKSPKM